MGNEMVAKTDIKFYVHTNNNAPQLTNNFGCMLNVLDAALINGIQVGTINSMTSSGKVVTVVFGASHNLMQYQVIKITGASQAEYNVEARILTIPNASTITFELAAAPATTVATGTISCSLPPLGWEKPFSSIHASGGGKGAYRSKNTLLASRPFLRVADEIDPVYTATYAKFAKVAIVEDMTDINTMLGVQAPYDSANPDKNWIGTGSGATAYNGWAKWYYALPASAISNPIDSSVASAGNRAWILVGNSDYFYILPATLPSDTWALCYGFGAFQTLLNADTSNTFLSTTYSYHTANQNNPKASNTGLAGTITTQKILLLRNYSQAALPQEAFTLSLGKTDILSGSSNYIGAYNLINIAPFSPVFINENVLRGGLYGFYWLFQNKPFNNYQLIERNGGLYIAVNIAAHYNSQGQAVLKIGDL